MKLCALCKKYKPDDEFYLMWTGRLSSYCKPCCGVKNKERMQKIRLNPHLNLLQQQYHKKYNATWSDKVKKYRKKWYEKNKKKVNVI